MKAQDRSATAMTVLLFFACLALTGSAPAQPTNYADEAAVTNYVRQLLYWTDATGTNKDLAAFRYKTLLYTNDGGIRARFESFSGLYGAQERTRALQAEACLQAGLTNHPHNPVLGGLLLDLYYDRTVAERTLAQQALVDAGFIRFAQTSAPPAYVIDSEISAYTNVLLSTRQALAGYLGLLTNHLGLGSDPDLPLGYEIFQQQVPGRGLDPASYLSNGVPASVIPNTAPLFTGYKDLVLLYELLRDYGRTAKEVVRLRLCRGNSTDTAQALDQISQSKRFLYLHAELLRGVFPGLAPTEDDPSGLAEAMAACTQCLEELDTYQQVIVGKRNVLGFEPDFLMLVQKFTGGSSYYDSYDALRERLSPSYEGPLKWALDEWTQARNAYDEYRGYEDQLDFQLSMLTAWISYRLYQIDGVYPGDPGYETPELNTGSEIYQQARSIEAARLRIQRNQVEIDNLNQEVQIEMWRANTVNLLTITFADKQASITEKIGHINAVQEAANALAEAANSTTWWGGGAHVVNAAVQAGAEEWKGQLEAEKERQAGLEQAQIGTTESDAKVKTLLLNMNTLAVDSQEAAVLLKQELGRMAGLYDEKQNLERKLAEQQDSLSERYFADPSHRLESQSDMVMANLSFDDAQKWMFFMSRALEYKWNKPFSNYYAGRIWTSASVFKLRNADELEDLWRAMDNFEQYIAGTVIVGTNRFDWFSVRKDFMGYADGKVYQDPETGLLLDAISAFRTNLLRHVTSPNPGNDFCEVEFDTVRQIPGGFFFSGPIFYATQPPTVYDPGKFLDKINYMKIRLVGQSLTRTNPLAGKLSYGGSSYIRKPRVGAFDPAHPDRLQNEFTVWSTRYWYNLGGGWEFTDRQTVSDAYLECSPVQNPDIPPGTDQITEFAERSVAATGWKLAIPVSASSVTLLNVQELDDILIYFQHRSAQRF